jgi:predicted RNase H-like nuclease
LARDRGSGQVIAGADGCRGGWIVVVETGRELSAWLAPTIDAVVERLPAGALLAIDIPIGLPSRGDRRCCKDARRLLRRPRASSVFPVPVRACLLATSYAGAAALHRAADGRGITKQAWSILPKITEVDSYVRRARAPRVGITEIHPEVSFAQWRGAPMAFPKITGDGRREREALIDG